MQWYEGNIAEAIQKSKQDGAVFGVAIFGEFVCIIKIWFFVF
jgi:hypothetical protein